RSRRDEMPAVWRDVVVPADLSEIVRPGEQAPCRTAAEGGAERDRHREQRVAIDEEQLASISRPYRCGAAVGGNLVPRSWTWKWANVDLGSARFVGHVRDPAAIRREGRRMLVRGGLQKRCRLAIRDRKCPDVAAGCGGALPEQHRSAIRRDRFDICCWHSLGRWRGGLGWVDPVEAH